MVNLEIRKFKETIVTMVNASPLPIEVKRMTFNEVAQAINDAANTAVMEEQKAYEEQQKKEPEDKEEE